MHVSSPVMCFHNKLVFCDEETALTPKHLSFGGGLNPSNFDGFLYVVTPEAFDEVGLENRTVCSR